MFRRPPVPSVCLIIGLSVAAIAPPAWSQDRSTQERLDRLERDLNMLQRQVYRGAPPPPMMGGDPGGAVNAQLRMDRLEGEMRELTGRVEEFINQVEQIRQRVDQIGGDVDMRLSQGGPGAGQLATAGPPPMRSEPGRSARVRQLPPEPPSAPTATNEDFPPPPFAPGGRSGPMTPPSVAGPIGAGPAPIFGTLTPPGMPPGPPPSPELASAAPVTRPSAGGMLPDGSATEQ